MAGAVGFEPTSDRFKVCSPTVRRSAIEIADGLFYDTKKRLNKDAERLYRNTAVE